MFLAHVLADAFFQLLHCPTTWRSLREQRSVDMLGRVPPRASHDDPSLVLIPFEDRAGYKAKLPTHFGRD
jgi:hypothetical protein